MLTVISPAKTLDYDTAPVTERFTLPQYLDDSQELIVQLRELSPAQISELMHLSDKLAGLNAARFGSWTPDFTPANAKQALLAFMATYTPAWTLKPSAKTTSPTPSSTCACFPACMACCARST